jgi:hypothetical protein
MPIEFAPPLTRTERLAILAMVGAIALALGLISYAIEAHKDELARAWNANRAERSAHHVSH